MLFFFAYFVQVFETACSKFCNRGHILPTVYLCVVAVERALEVEFTIDNLTFTPGLADHDSKEFKEIAASVEEEVILSSCSIEHRIIILKHIDFIRVRVIFQLKKALFDHSTLRATDIKIRVINLT